VCPYPTPLPFQATHYVKREVIVILHRCMRRPVGTGRNDKSPGARFIWRHVGFVAALACAVMGIFSAGAQAEGACPNAALRQGHSASLPDCRAYELVTPPYKQGARVEVLAASPDGSRVLVHSLGNFGDANQNQNTAGATYVLTRTQLGWRETNVDLPASQYPYDGANGILDVTPDLGRVLFEGRATTQPLDAEDLVIHDADGTLHDLGPVSPPSSAQLPPGLGLPGGKCEYGCFTYRGASVELSHVLFTVQSDNGGGGSRLWPGDITAPGGFHSLYEYTAGQGGPPVLVGLDNGKNQLSQCGDITPGYPASHGVSAAGATVFFTAGALTGYSPSGVLCGGSGPGVDQLYARIGSPGSAQATVNIAGSSACGASASCDVTSVPTFVGASVDGSKAFFTSSQALSATDHDTTTDIYECDLPGDSGSTPTPTGVVNPCPSLRPISVTGGSSGANVQKVVAISDDGSHVYFIASGVLTSAPNQYGATASPNANNLYVYERDGSFPSGHVAFIGALSSSGSGGTATPDGRFLVFSDAAQLTPDDTSTARQVFEYDAQSGALVRVSIGQNGFNQNGNTNVFDAGSPGRSSTLANSLSGVSNDGAYVVFASADGLTPGALNGRPTDTSGVFAKNIYVHHNGNVRLISDGQDASSFVSSSSSVTLEGMTPSGGDVFFQTADQLVAQDTDTQRDLYDARIGGGFPAGQGALACQGDACRGALASAPSGQSPGSSSFSGPGNASPAAVTAMLRRLTRAQKLAKALKACRAKHNRHKRAGCSAQARKKYGAAHNAKRTNRRGK
jgi:hypothetical protein